MRWLNVGLSGFIAWKAAMLFGLSLGGLVGVFIVSFVILGLVTGGLSGGIWNSGLFTTLPVRRMVGLAADGLLVVVLWWVGTAIVDWLGIWGWVYASNNDPGQAQNRATFAWLIWGWFALVMPLGFMTRLKVLLGRAAVPVARIVRARFIGMGGSSQFGGLFNDWAHPWKSGQLILGGSMYSPGWKVGRSDDRHFITIATSRSGKGRSGIIPNLLTWPGSALVIDPKGQNAAVTAAARGYGDGRVKKGLGQSIRIVDPFAQLKGQGVELPTHRFNPLAELDPAALDAVEQIRRLTDALVVPDPSGNSDFWDRSASNVISGIIAHVLTDPAGPPEKRTLFGVRDVLRNIGNESIRKSMAQNHAVGGLAQAAVSTLRDAGENTEGGIITTALSHTDWLDSLAMKEALGASDFSLSELKEKPCTVYLVLPPDLLDVHGRFPPPVRQHRLAGSGAGQKTALPDFNGPR